jgi:hypothetical protein
MSRVTIMLDDDLEKMIRIKQAKKIQSENKSYSFSEALNDFLREKL